MSKMYTGSWTAFGTFEIEADTAKQAQQMMLEELESLSFIDANYVGTDGMEVEVENHE